MQARKCRDACREVAAAPADRTEWFSESSRGKMDLAWLLGRPLCDVTASLSPVEWMKAMANVRDLHTPGPGVQEKGSWL